MIPSEVEPFVATGDISTASLLLWVALPYVCFATMIVGFIWRYKYDKFGWTTKSSQTYEKSLLRIASPLFHYGMLAVLAGHLVGLLIPYQWTEALGIEEHTYHTASKPLSLTAGTVAVVGMVMLIYRRRTNSTVFSRTTANDKLMYLFLGATVLFGLFASWKSAGLMGDEANYRDDVSVWLRSVLIFQPEAELMARTEWQFQLHAIAGFVMFAVWPFTRLVHALSVPIQYLARPYVVYRSRGKRDTYGTGNRVPRRGWEPSRRD